jgi:hypothetical protein
MKFTSQIIAAASGSVGGCTYSRNRFGQYIRNRSLPVNTQTAFQQAVRNAFQQLASRWTSILTQTQRDTWDIYAANVPVIDPLGNSQNLSGINWYIAANSLRLQAATAIVDDASPIFSQADLQITSASVNSGTQLITTTYPAGQDWAAAVDGGLLVYGSRPFSPSINFFKGPYRFAEFIQGAAVPPASPQTSPLPFVVVSGQKVGIAYRVILPDGRFSALQRFTSIAA